MLFRWVSERQARLTKIPMNAFDDEPKMKLVAIRAFGRGSCVASQGRI
jgi:hypothetical protein